MTEDLLLRNLCPREEYIFGTADLTGIIHKKFEKFRFGISIGKKLDDNIVEAIEHGPTLEYFEHYTQTNKELAEIAGKIKKELLKTGIDSIAIRPTVAINSKQADFHYPTLTFDLSHKMVANLNGSSF